MSVAFSTPDGDIIAEKVSVEEVTTTPETELRDRYQLDQCCHWITDHSYRLVALQFPDELLSDSAPIALFLEEETQASIFILADTSYGSCCVDEVAADHVSADCIIHFGHSCLSATSRLPVHFVFVDLPLDVSAVAGCVRPALDSDSTVVVFADVRYQHALAALCGELSSLLPSSRVLAAEPVLPSPSDPAPEPAGVTTVLNRRVPLTAAELSAATVLHLGPQGRTLAALAVSLADTRVVSYDPSQPSRPPTEQTTDTSRAIRRRFYLIERAKDAQRVGILVGTLAVRRYPEAIARLKRLLRLAGKRYYTLVCGKLNVAKLANFPELDVLVLVSCAESALLESRHLLRPLVTPYEMELACNPGRQWSGRYVAEFARLLPGGADYVPLSESSAGVTTDVSLVTGRLRRVGVEETAEASGAGDQQVVQRDALTVAVHAGGAGQALTERSWRGLQVNSGDTPVQKVTQGSRGVAAGYEQEGTDVRNETVTAEHR